MSIYIDKKKLLTSDTQNDLLQTNSETKAQDNIDFDNVNYGMKFVNGVSIINAPKGSSRYGMLLAFDMGSNMIQLYFDITNTMYSRSFSGRTGRAEWSPWAKIGGVISPAYMNDYVALQELEVA